MVSGSTGGKITEPLASETVGTIILRDDDTPAGSAAVLCSGILDGTVGPGGEDSITVLLDLAKKEITLAGPGLLCERVETCAAASEASPIEVWALKLPWHTELFLMENGEILDLIVGAEYELLCLVVGLMVEDKCASADSGVLVINDPLTGDAESPAGAELLHPATCSLGGAESGLEFIDELSEINLVSGELLSVSSE